MEQRARDLWVDFDDIAADGTTSTLARFATDGVSIEDRATIFVGDDEGNRCVATVTSNDGTIVKLWVDMDKFQPSSCTQELAHS